MQRGSKITLPQREAAVEVVESDEIHSYVGSKKNTVGYGLLLIDIQNGSSHLCVEATETEIILATPIYSTLLASAEIIAEGTTNVSATLLLILLEHEPK